MLRLKLIHILTSIRYEWNKPNPTVGHVNVERTNLKSDGCIWRVVFYAYHSQMDAVADQGHSAHPPPAHWMLSSVLVVTIVHL